MTRSPLDNAEHALVNGFSQVPFVQEIRIRYTAPRQPGGLELCKVYLLFSIIEAQSLEHCDRRQDEFRLRTYHDPIEYVFVRKPISQPPVDAASVIWVKPMTVGTL